MTVRVGLAYLLIAFMVLAAAPVLGSAWVKRKRDRQLRSGRTHRIKSINLDSDAHK